MDESSIGASNKAAGMSVLPQEVLEHIFCESVLSYRDICRLALVCRAFRNACSSSELWKKLFKRRWPRLMKLYKGLSGLHWKDEFRERHCCSVRICHLISQMSPRFYDLDELSQDAFADFLKISEHQFLHHFLIDELERILYDGHVHSNLTIKYYTERVLRHIQHCYLQTKWKEFLGLPPEQQFLEKGAILFAKWCQPSARIRDDVILQEIDSLAARVKDDLKLRYPNHPLSQRGLHPAESELPESLWLPAECRMVLTTMNVLLFRQLKFKGNGDYYDALNSYIDMVLVRRLGIPITLCILYAAVAHRLGVLCHLVSFPGHFLLKWKEHPDYADDEAYTFIDVYNEGQFLSRAECGRLLPPYQLDKPESFYETAQPIQVFRRMCWNIVDVGRQEEGVGDSLMCLRNALELLTLLSPDDVEHRLLLARVYLHLNINFNEVIHLLQEISERDPSSTAAVAFMHQAAQSQMSATRKRAQNRMAALPKSRAKHPNVAFAVGMIMRHKKYDYTCVIYGWDPMCTARKDWIYQMGVHNLAQKDKQPFYNVLVDDGSNRYAAQENLEVCQSPKPINHPDVGKYFQHFCETHYVPNEEKSSEYPEDEPVRMRFVQDTFKK